MLIAINFGKYNKVTDIRPDFPFPDKKNVMQGYVRFKPAFTSFLVSASYTTLKVAEVISDPYMKLNLVGWVRKSGSPFPEFIKGGCLRCSDSLDFVGESFKDFDW